MEPRTRFPNAILERFLLGELPDGRQEEIRNILATDADLAARLETLKRSDRDILAAYPGLAGLRHRTAKEKSANGPSGSKSPLDRLRAFSGLSMPPRWLQAGGLAFAGLILLSVITFPGTWNRAGAGKGSEGATGDQDPAIRLKGAEAGLAIFRKSKSGTELLPPHSSARPGDTLQVFYRSLKEVHGMIFSVDGNGSVTLHLPEEEGLSERLAPGDLRPVPHAYLLDKAPKMERFYLVTSPSAFSIPSILSAFRGGIRPGAPLPDSVTGLPEGFRQYSYTLKKEDARPASGRPGKGRRP